MGDVGPVRRPEPERRQRVEDPVQLGDREEHVHVDVDSASRLGYVRQGQGQGATEGMGDAGVVEVAVDGDE